MKANSRRRVLISSVAMLLVALVALSTATFAWFTQSTTATASGINVKTIKSSELKISSLNKAWGTTVNYQTGYNSEGTKGDAKILLPVSSADGSAWFTTNAITKDSFAATKTDGETPQYSEVTTVTAANKGTYYFANQLNVKNEGEATVEDVTITFALGTDTDVATKEGYYRIALVPVTDTEDNTDTLPNAATNFFATEEDGTLKNIFGLADTAGYQALKGTDLSKSESFSATVKPNTATSVTVGDLTEDQAAYYNLYVWFEGQDQDCKDANAGATIPQITFTVTGTTANQTN